MPLERISIVGAGPVGCLLSLELAQRGYSVDLYERRPDIRKSKIPAGRSINLALSLRGIHALSEMGIDKKILENAIPMLGRMMHDTAGVCTFQRYGMTDDQYINSISRAELNRALLDAVEGQNKCRIFFGHRLTRYDFTENMMHFHDETTGRASEKSAECVVGSDGSASALRESMVSQCNFHCEEEPLDYGYKELTIPAGPAGVFPMERGALHIWPRGKFMLIALPNHDGSFTCTLFLPFTGAESFETFTHDDAGRARIRDFFAKYFPDAARLIPDLEEALIQHPLGKMVTVKCENWHHKSQALLIGDAAHAIVPFFGQGLNASFEDCTLLSSLLDGGEALEKTFENFFRARKPDTDAIAQLAKENFVEMRDKVGHARFLLEKEIEKRLMKAFPKNYVSRYAMVTFSRQPYRRALIAGRAQDKILGQLSEGIHSAEEVDIELAKQLIEQYKDELNPNDGRSHELRN